MKKKLKNLAGLLAPVDMEGAIIDPWDELNKGATEEVIDKINLATEEELWFFYQDIIMNIWDNTYKDKMPR